MNVSIKRGIGAVILGLALASTGTDTQAAPDTADKTAIKNVADFQDVPSMTGGIQEAIDSLPATGGAVVIPPGEYVLRSYVRLRDNISLIGSGASTILKKDNDFQVPIIQDAKKGQKHVVVEDASGLVPGMGVMLLGGKNNFWWSCYRVARIEGNRVFLECTYTGRNELAKDVLVSEKARLQHQFPMICISRSHNNLIRDVTIDGNSEKQLRDSSGAGMGCGVFPMGNHCKVESCWIRNMLRDGITYNTTEFGVVCNCVIHDNRRDGIHLGGGAEAMITGNDIHNNAKSGIYFCAGNWHSSHNLVENCASYGIEADNAVDYYIVIGYSHDNVVRNCVTRNKHLRSKSHAGHGIAIKDTFYKGKYSGTHSYNNKIINCQTHGHGEHLWVAHYAHHNEFINCTAHNEDLNPYHQWNHGLVVRDGAHHNVFRNCTAIGMRSGANLHDTNETPETAIQAANRFLNCIFDVTDAGMYLSHARENMFRHCVITGAKKLFGSKDESDNTLANCIVTNIPSWGSGKPTITYSDFWNCGFDVPSGIGNVGVDPLFAGPAKGDYHLRSTAGRWAKGVWVKDDVTSPCIDAGDPEAAFDKEPELNGHRANMGAYGNTPEASKSPRR